jgi:dihydroorotate dehydrogenase
MSEIDLASPIGNFLTLNQPFWIASAHFSEKESVIDTWADIRPAALTLKTSCKAPIEVKETKQIRRKTTEFMTRFSRSYYCDGPKTKELITYERTAELLKYAREKLPDTRVGISVICDARQDYGELRALCPDAAFCELNLKYIFRFSREEERPEFFKAASKRFDDLLEQLEKFTKAFQESPVLIKVSRELAWLPGTKELEQFLNILVKHGKAGLVVANSLKLNIPIFIADGQERVLQNGVICGEALFDQTISLIESFNAPCIERNIPIVATGGMIEPEHTLMALKAGASAVQLCTAFDYYRPNYYNTLCWNLQNRIELLGLRSFSEFLLRLRKDSVATIYNMPFMYFEKFWSADIQRRLQKDVRDSERMDVFVMSGKSVVEEWEDALKSRFGKNLGMRIVLPNPDGQTYESIQRSWGITDLELRARKQRVREAYSAFEKIWRETQDARQKIIPAGEKESNLEISLTDKCPFYSFYLFDDKVYVAPYPFIRPGEPNIPVYIFFAGSHEYERIKKEAQTLFEYARQSKT